MRKGRVRIAIVLVALILSVSARPAAAVGSVQALLWAGAAAATPPYTALKVGLAAAATGAAAWMLVLTFDPDAAAYLFRRGIAGDWWVRPTHLTGESPLEPLPAIEAKSRRSGRTLGGYPIE
jgi:hypothetical protein